MTSRSPSETGRPPGAPRAARDVALLALGALLGASGFWVGAEVARRDEPDVGLYRAVRDYVQTTFVRELDTDRLLDQALRGMVEELDGYSRYYAPGERPALQRETTGRYQGIGVVFTRPTSAGRILFALPGSPADRAGLGTGDRVLSVDGTSVVELGEGGLVAALTDPARDELRLSVEARDGTRRQVRVVRQELIDPTVRHERTADSDLAVGYVALTSFSEESPDELDRALDALLERGLRGLVLDLRGNTGGVLRSAVRVANRFLAEGLIVSTEGRGDPVEYAAEGGQARYPELPLVVLVDRDSASASEVVAGALQDHRRAVIVGERTYGKGMVQRMHEFGERGAVVKLTTSYYYTPSHRNLERTVPDAWDFGITPDVLVELSDGERRSVHAYLARYGPPAEAIDAIRAWEREEGVQLLPQPPPDAQLEAALDLFAGRRPGPYRTDS